MTEAAWLGCKYPDAMVTHLWRSASARRMRLFAVACCRRLPQLLEDAPCCSRIEAAERNADEVAQGPLGSSAQPVQARFGDAARWVLAASAFDAAKQTSLATLSLAVPYSPMPTTEAAWQARQLTLQEERRSQILLLRDIFGNPFRPSTFANEWRTDTAASLAHQMYEARDFSAMLILADALQDAGCENEEILNHCRSESVHVRACWVVDLVLSKG